MPNPRIAPIRLGRYLLLDPADAPGIEDGRASLKASRGFQRWRAGHPDGDPLKERLLCDEDDAKQQANFRAWAKAQERFPNLTFDRFMEETGGVLTEPADWDRRLPWMVVTVLKDGIGHGKLTITNMSFEVDETGKIEARGFPLYWSDPEDRTEMLREAARVFQYFLDNDIELRGGNRVLDIVEYNFLSVDGRGWREGDTYGFGRVLRAIRAVGVRQGDRESPDFVPRRIRRLDAPRQFDGGEIVERDSELPPRLLRALRNL